MTENPSQRLARIAALESRLGLRLADRLSEGAEKLEQPAFRFSFVSNELVFVFVFKFC